MEKGKLILKSNKENNYGKDKIEYGIYNGKGYVDLTEMFTDSLTDKVEVIIKVGNNTYRFKGEMLFKNVNGLWMLHVGKDNIDKILWDNVGKEVEFKMSVVKEGKEIDDNESGDIKC